MKNIETILEALLFVKTEPISKKRLALFLKTDLSELGAAVSELKIKLSDRGIRLVEHDDSVMLGTAPEASEVIESILKEELNKDLGRAGLETISIILYKNPVTKNEIDFIRGVNSQFILRNLLIRGLVEKAPNPNGRSSLYKPTLELIRYLGIEKVESLPDYEKTASLLSNFSANANSVLENGVSNENGEGNKTTVNESS